jgi:small nuclear ribonucleoprotein (snRNP)-like protein
MLNHLENLGVCTNLNTDFVTFDIESVDINKIKTPYLICAYNGTNYIESFGLNQDELFIKFIDQLLTFFKDKNTLTVYAHNLSNFDGIFLWSYLTKYGKVDPLEFNDKLICIKVKLNMYGYKNKTIIFKDSYLLIPASLRELCKTFKLTESKGIFPFKFNNIYYKGSLPKFEHFTNITLEEYTLIKNQCNTIWNFKEEAIKYCKLDCETLHKILTKFNELIYNKWKINIHKTLTLPSLAMKIYKSHYMPKDTLYQLHSLVEKNIRKSYTGGAVDVYIPHNRKTTFLENNPEFITLYYYDVNSLYPSVMANNTMPVGKPVIFEGYIREVEPNAYGFFYCKITSPEYLEHPILQRRIKTSEGLRTIAGLGSWEGWIYSEEMDNAIKYGYQFEIIKGYQFEKGDIFSGYVNKLYSLRLQYEKAHAMNLIAKLLMNSLYGKFGMRMETTTVDIFDVSDDLGVFKFNQAVDMYGETILDYIKFDGTYVIVRSSYLDLKYDKDENMFHGMDVNIAIASAVTGAARIYMSAFKNNPLFKLYYSDTDSIVIDKPLPVELVGSDLGQMKLEHTIERAVFLAPKVYSFITESAATSEEVIKVKGVSHDIASNLHVNDLEELLIKDSSKELNQEKWYKKVIEGEITVEDVAYSLKATSNKREAIYIDGVYSDTKPYKYDDLIK